MLILLIDVLIDDNLVATTVVTRANHNKPPFDCSPIGVHGSIPSWRLHLSFSQIQR